MSMSMNVFEDGREGKGTRGRVPTNGSRKYQVKAIWNQHHEIMRLSLCGWKQADIARHLGVSEAMVTYTLNSEIVRKQMAIMRGARDAEALDVAIEIKRLAPLALKRLEEVLSDETAQARLRVEVAKDLLDRAGYAPVKQIEGKMLNMHLTAEDIEDIKNRAKAAGMISNNVVDKQVYEEIEG